MKKNILYLVAVVATLSFFAACSGGAKDQIARKWKFSEMSSPAMDRGMAELHNKVKAADDSLAAAGADTMKAAMFKMEKESAESQLKMYDEMMANMKEKSSWEFTKDGKFTMDMGGQNESGTWSISDDGKKLMTTDSKGKNDTLSIAEVSAEKLMLSMERDSTSITFVPAAAEAK